MIANFFNNAKPIKSIILLFILIAFYILAHFGIEIKFFSLEFWSLRFGGLLLLIALFFVFNFIITKNKLTLTNSFALLFICLSIGLFYPILSLPKVLTAQLFLALSFRRIYSLRTSNGLNEKLFDSAFLIAISSFFYIENAYFIILVYVALFVFQRTNWRYFIIPLVGFALPYFLTYIYALSFDSFSFFNSITEVSFSFNFGIIKQASTFLIVDILFLMGCLAYILKTLRTSEFSNEFRALWSLVLAHFLIASLLIFTGVSFGLEKVVYIVFPYGIIMANYMQTINKKWLKELLVFLLVGLTLGSIIYNFVP
jgi:hypothetical protein